jgi:hypothetical protein
MAGWLCLLPRNLMVVKFMTMVIMVMMATRQEMFKGKPKSKLEYIGKRDYLICCQYPPSLLFSLLHSTPTPHPSAVMVMMTVMVVVMIMGQMMIVLTLIIAKNIAKN